MKQQVSLMKSYYKKNFKLVFFLPFLFLMQCGILFGPESPGFIDLPIEGKIEFSIFEDYENYDSISEPFLNLSMVTEKFYGCLGYSINANINIVGNNVIVRIFGIKTPLGACATAIGPARFFDKLNLGGGEYNLLFIYKETVDSYYLTVTDSSIGIKQNNAEFTSTKLKAYWRYPENSFAYFLRINDESNFLYENFIDTLTTNIPISEFQFPDFGKNPFEYFNQRQLNNYFPLRYFKYENEEDFEKAGDLLKLYTENVIGNNLSVSLTLISWKNRRFTARQFMDK